MPAGLYVDFNDGGPPMIITAGMRGLIYAGDIPSGGALSVTLPNMKPNLPTYLLPRETFRFDGHPVNGKTVYLTGFSTSGSTLTQYVAGYGGYSSFAASVWQVDQSSPTSGLYIADCSDFTAIGLATALGFCVFRGTVTIDGSWAPPIPAGATGVCVFAKFSDGSKTLFFDGSTVTCWTNTSDTSYNAAVTAKIVIFVSGIEPTPRKGGLNMWNAAGKCTFSSNNRPFITYGKTVAITNGWLDTGGGLVQLGCYGGYRFGSSSRNQEWTKALGITMSGNSVMIGKAYSISVDTGYNPSTQESFYVPGLYSLVIPDIY